MPILPSNEGKSDDEQSNEVTDMTVVIGIKGHALGESGELLQERIRIR